MADSHEPFDTDGTQEMVCPHCGHEHGDTWELFSDIHSNTATTDCDECGKIFEVEANWSVDYTTRAVRTEGA